MRKSVLSLALFSLLTLSAVLANAAGPAEPALSQSTDDVSTLIACATPAAEGPQRVVNLPTGMPEPDPAQIAIPRCNCTRPGTTIPPGQLGVKCATPIGGPPRTCQAVTCLQNINTPWINGVCG